MGTERGHVLSKWGTGNEKQGIRTSHGRIALEKRTGLGYNDFSYKKFRSVMIPTCIIGLVCSV